MTKIAYFECMSGASGNMILGALLDAGLPVAELQAELEKLPVSGFKLVVTPVVKQGIAATHVEVETEETHAHRHLRHIVEIVQQSRLDEDVKRDCERIFTRLAEAEAKVHNTTLEKIHFHEVGALDAIVDVVGAVAGLRKLGIQHVYASAFALGTGFITCAHGRIPVPVPATVELLQGKPVRQTEIEAELVTPTGAAILSTLAEQFGPAPAMTLERVGYGAGTRDLPIPNALRLFIGHIEEASGGGGDQDRVVVLEANIDDMNPEIYDYVFEQLFALGALDVFTTPIMMKKNRPGVLLSALVPPALQQAATELLLRETTTIGVRWQPMQRTKAARDVVSVLTKYGDVRVKVARLGDAIVTIAPEYDDCKRLAQTLEGVTLKQVYQEAIRQVSP
jgi:pyridinium-3,5-bisthiocarboxylic acid mononucleotide nickel chelatase